MAPTPHHVAIGDCGARWRDATDDREIKCFECKASLDSEPEGGMDDREIKCFEGKSYCDRCWSQWWRCSYLRQQIELPAPYTGKSVRNFGGRRVHFFQVGLGTFGTVLVPDTSWMQALLECPVTRSQKPPKKEELRSIGVDCLEEAAGQQERLALLRRPGCSAVLLAAVADKPGERTLWCMPRGARLKIREYLREQDADESLRADVDHNMAYLENMSGIGEKPPEELHWKVEQLVEQLARQSEYYSHQLLEKRRVPCYTYQGILDLFNCSGCEIFLVDAEGADCLIVGSMIDACLKTAAKGKSTWPTIVRYETHAGSYEEDQTMRRLEKFQYMVIEAGRDATLIHIPRLIASSALEQWADEHYSVICYACGVRKWPSQRSFQRVVGRGTSQWYGTLKDQEHYKKRGKRWTAPGWCCPDCYRRK